MGEKRPGKRPYKKPTKWGWKIRPNKNNNRGTLEMGKGSKQARPWWEVGFDGDVDTRHSGQKPLKVMAPSGKNHGRRGGK